MGANKLTQQHVDELFRGARDDHPEPVFVDAAGREAGQPVTRGFYHIRPSAVTLPKAPDTGLPEGEKPKPLTRVYEDRAFQMLKFMAWTELPFAEANDYEQQQNESLAQSEMDRCVQTSDLKTDLHAAEVLGYDSENDQLLADDDHNNLTVDIDGDSDYGSKWEDSGATVFEDVRRIIREEVPGADTMIAGAGALDKMGERADFTTRDLNFSGGSVNRSRVVELLEQEIEDLERVVPISRFYNVNADGQSVSKNWVYKYGVWIGYGDDFVWLPLTTDNPRSLEDDNGIGEAQEIGTVRRGLFDRPVKELGVTVDAFGLGKAS